MVQAMPAIVPGAKRKVLSDDRSRLAPALLRMDKAFGPCSASSAVSSLTSLKSHTPRAAAAKCAEILARFEALQTTSTSFDARRYTIKSSRIVPRSLQQQVYMAWPSAARAMSLLTSELTSSRALSPCSSSSPMCDTSNRPARSRTAWCSTEMPLYWMGISQPANGTSRAPRAACFSCKDVRFNNSSLTPPAYRDPDSGTRQEAPAQPGTKLFVGKLRPARRYPKSCSQFRGFGRLMLTFARGKRPDSNHRARRVGVDPARQVPR